jgi:tRNA uridine 5-carbamoylmethylation protein Kti12
MLDAGKPVVITDGLAKLLANQSLLKNKNLMVLKVDGDPKKLLKLSREELKPLRDMLLAPMGIKFDAPNKVSLYMIDSNYIVIENFNDIKVDLTLELPVIKEVKKVLMLPDDGNMVLANSKNSLNIRELSPRTLIVLQYK